MFASTQEFVLFKIVCMCNKDFFYEALSFLLVFEVLLDYALKYFSRYQMIHSNSQPNLVL